MSQKNFSEVKGNQHERVSDPGVGQAGALRPPLSLRTGGRERSRLDWGWSCRKDHAAGVVCSGREMHPSSAPGDGTRDSSVF